MNFDEAIASHVHWKIRLRVQLSENGETPLDADDVSHDDDCILGKWIYGEASYFGRDAAYRKLRDEHVHFHLTAAEIIRLMQSGKRELANALLEGEFNRRSFGIVAAINTMRRHYEQPLFAHRQPRAASF